MLKDLKMSTNLFKKTDQAKSAYTTVGIERKKICVLLVLFMSYPHFCRRTSESTGSPCAELVKMKQPTNAHCFAFSSALKTLVPVYMRFWSFLPGILRKERWKRKVKAEEDQKLWSRYVLFSLFSLFGGAEGEGGGGDGDRWQRASAFCQQDCPQQHQSPREGSEKHLFSQKDVSKEEPENLWSREPIFLSSQWDTSLVTDSQKELPTGGRKAT